MSAGGDRGWRAHAAWAIPTLLGAVVALAWLGAVPGLSADEVWALHRVRELSEGARPVRGMFFYCGAIPQYLAWPFVALGGESALTLRLPGALLHAAALAITTTTLRCVANARVALFGGLGLATAPIFAGSAHVALELWVLTPFLAAVAFASFARVDRDGSVSFAALGGLALGLMVENHMATLPVPVGLAVAVVAVTRARVLRRRVAWATLGGFVLGLVPLALTFTTVDADELAALSARSGWPPWAALPTEASPWPDLPHVFVLLATVADGTLAYQSWAGGSTLPVLPLYPLIALAALVGLRARHRLARPTPRVIAGVATFVGAALATALIAPRLTIRYFVVFHFTLALLPALVAAPLLSHEHARTRRVSHAILIALVSLHAVYVASNFFAPFLTRGGGLSVHPIGTRMIDTSNELVRTDALYDALRARGVRRYAAEYMLALPLSIHDRARALESIDMPDDEDAPPATVDVPTALIFYDGVVWDPDPRAMRHDARDLGEAIRRGGVLYRRDPRFPPLFRVYLAWPAAPPDPWRPND